VQLASGSNSITVIGTDLAGNTSSATISVTNTGASSQSNPPAISGVSPNQGGIGSTVTVTGSAFGAAQASSVLMFNGIPAQITNWSASSITASVPSGLNPGVATVNVAVNGSASTGAQFTVTAPLFIDPNQITMLVGKSQPIELVDENGVAVSGATWILANTTLAQTIPPTNGQPTFLQANSTGITTLIGSYGSRTAVASVMILPDGSPLPNGTLIWSVPSLGSYGMSAIVYPVSGPSGPSIYAEDDGAYGGNGAIRAFDANGQQMWIWPSAPSDKFPLLLSADSQGGAIYFASQDNPNQYESWCYFGRVDQNGNETWEYQETNCNEDYGVAPDGTIYLVEPEFQNNGTVTITALNPTTGQIKFTVPMPGASQNTSLDESNLYDTNTENYYTYCTPGASPTTSSDPMANIGLMSVDANGNANIPFSTVVYTFDAEPCDSSPDPNDPGYPHKVTSADGSWTSSQSLQLMTIHPDGSYSTKQLDSASSSGTATTESGTPGFTGFNRAIPDGQGGVLFPIYNPPTLYHASPSGVSKFSLPVAPIDSYDGFPDPKSTILGENGLAFVTGSSSQYSYPIDTVVAINMNSGAIPWTYASQGGAVSLIAATDGGGLVINDSQGGVTQLDSTGAPTSTGIIGSNISLTNSWNDGWYALDFPGTNGGVSAVNLSANVDDPNPWPAPEGKPSAAHSAQTEEVVYLRSFAPYQWFGPELVVPWFCPYDCFRGDDRSFSTSTDKTVTSRVTGIVRLLLPQLVIVGTKVYSDPSRDIWGRTKTGQPAIIALLTNGSSLYVEIDGTNPLVPPAPAIVTSMSVEVQVTPGQVCYSGNLKGNAFPNSEAFVINSLKQASTFHTFSTTYSRNGGPFELFGSNNRDMGTFSNVCVTP
jgi:hypothetical protein